MSAAASLSGASLTSAQQQFTATLKAVEDAARFAFRRLRPQEYEEKLTDARAAAWSAWTGLIRRGKDPLAVGVHGIANNAVRYVRNGRKLGCGSAGRGMDVYHRKAQAKCGFRLVSLDSGDAAAAGPSCHGEWRDWLVEDNTCTPADQAAFRLDWETWLSRLPERKRRIAELLAEGHEGLVVARAVGCSPGRVSQVRAELEASWREFQGQAPEAQPTPLACKGAAARAASTRRP